MINRLHSLLHDPARGWDPVPADYAEQYARGLRADLALVDRFDALLGGFAGKRVVDLGSGPGQYAAEFARRGAEVTCIDVSRTYLSMAERRVAEAGGVARIVPGYMEAVDTVGTGYFDAAFSNVTWYYCMNDQDFARRILRALKPGGVAFVQANIDAFERARSVRRNVVYWLNDVLSWKVGHPHPPRDRIARVFRKAGADILMTDYGDPVIDRVAARRRS